MDQELLNAALYGYIEKVEELIKSGANVNAADKFDGITALELAASNEHKEIVELLIKHNANVNAIDKCGNTALIAAARYKYKKIVELLLCSGANIEHKNLYGKKAIDFVEINDWDSELIKNNKQEIVKMLQCEQSRREAVVKKWIKEHLARKITEATSDKLFSDISNIIAEYYSIEYRDIPLEYRLNN